MTQRVVFLTGLICLLVMAHPSPGQVVAVRAQLDTNVISIGQSTTLRVYAQVLPAYRAAADRIFSWYVDVLNTNSTAAIANYASMLKTASDQDPLTSSNGFTSGSNRLGIYDTFLNRPAAGVSNEVELLSIPVSGLALGQTRFGIRAGTSVPNLSEDFIVAPAGGGLLMTGGDYNNSFAILTVLTASSNALNCLNIVRTNLPGGSNQVTIRFCPSPGYNYYVEYRDQLVGGPGWQTFPNSPHNTGVYVDSSNQAVRFYRVRVVPVAALAAFRLDIMKTNGSQLRLTYPVAIGFNYTIESRTNLVTGSWQPLPGAPHNSGIYIDTNNVPVRFYRIWGLPAG